MVDIHRIKLFCNAFLFFCLLACSIVANAGSAKVLQVYFSFDSKEHGPYSSVSGACSSFAGMASRDGISVSITRTTEDDTAGTCYFKNYYNGTVLGEGSQAVTKRLACPAGSIELADGTCGSGGQCPVGMEKNASGACVCKPGLEKGPDGICVPTEDTQCKAFYLTNSQSGGSLVQNYRLQGNIADGTTYCMPGQFDNQNRGCKVVFDRDSYADYGSGHSVTEGQFNAKPGDSGLACNVGDVETPAKPPDEKCKGGYTGTVNGVEVCISKVPDSGVGSNNNSTTNNDGQNTTTTNTNSQTDCKDGKCTTTTTTTTTITNNSTGSSTTTTATGTTTESQGSFCSKNPKSKLCGGNGNGDDKSSFSGSCSAGFKCEGDAIQCSIAQEQYRRSCKLFDDKSPESELYEKEKGKEGNQTNELPGNETVSIQGKIDMSDAIGGGSAGLSDLNITVWHTNVSLPFSMLNKYLVAMGNVLLAVSLLVAFRIVARG